MVGQSCLGWNVFHNFTIASSRVLAGRSTLSIGTKKIVPIWNIDHIASLIMLSFSHYLSTKWDYRSGMRKLDIVWICDTNNFRFERHVVAFAKPNRRATKFS